MLEYESLKWMAGFFDGEGYVGIHFHQQGNFPTPKLTVQVTNTDTRALAIFHERFGGSKWRSYPPKTGAKPHHLKVYRWTLNSAKALAFLEVIAPHLIVKKEQVELAIQFWKLPWRGAHKKGSGRSQEQIETDLEIAGRLKKMKHTQVA
jgi:hypothetical protein